jgi:lysozyme
MTARKKTLAGVAGATAAALLLVLVPRHEGEVLATYSDPVGIATVCYGDTDPAMAVPGAVHTREECLRSLERQLVAHAEPVIDCLDIDPAAYPHQTAAIVSLAYHIGVRAFCSSTVAGRWRAGDHVGACRAIDMWRYAKGRELPGLVRRRADERRLCETDLPIGLPTAGAQP